MIFSRLPPGVQALTVPRLSRRWASWAAPRAAALRVRAGGAAALCSDCPDTLLAFEVPHWCLAAAGAARLRALPAPRRRALLMRAAAHGDAASARLLREAAGAPWGSKACRLAAAGGHVEALAYLLQAGCPMNRMTLLAAAAGGHLEAFCYARAAGCPRDPSACIAAAAGGHAAVLARCVADAGLAAARGACLAAALGGHVEALRVAAEARPHAFYWDECRAVAAEEGHAALVRWLDALPAARRRGGA